MSTQKPASAANPPPDFSNCPHWGKGGRYVIDAAGNRVPVIETDAADEAAPAGGDAQKPAAATESSAKKGK